MSLKIVNRSKNTILAERCEIAQTSWQRMRGLLGRTSLASGEGLVIKGCNSIHMFFMRFAIDVVFVDKKGRVVGIVQNILPFRLSPLFWKADSAIELPAGAVILTNTALNDQIDLIQ